MISSSSSYVVHKFGKEFLTEYQEIFGELKPDFFEPLDTEPQHMTSVAASSVSSSATAPAQQASPELLFSKTITSSNSPEQSLSLKDRKIEVRKNNRKKKGKEKLRQRRGNQERTRHAILTNPDHFSMQKQRNLENRIKERIVPLPQFSCRPLPSISPQYQSTEVVMPFSSYSSYHQLQGFRMRITFRV